MPRNQTEESGAIAPTTVCRKAGQPEAEEECGIRLWHCSPNAIDIDRGIGCIVIAERLRRARFDGVGPFVFGEAKVDKPDRVR